MNHVDLMKARHMELTGNFLYLSSLIGGNHPNGAWEIDFMSQFNYKTYLKEWDTFFELVQKEHLDKGWYNPFISRHLYNFIRTLPVKVISASVFTILSQQTVDGRLLYNDEVESILNIDYLNCPLVFSPQQLTVLEDIHTKSPSKKLVRFMLFARSGQKFVPILREAEEMVIRSWQNLNNRYKDLQKEHISSKAQADSMANMRYEMSVLDALFKLPGSHTEYTRDYLNTLYLEESDKVKLEDFLGKPLSEIERQIYILSTSMDPIELVLTMKAFLENKIAEQEVFVLTKGFRVLVERFEYYTKIKPMHLTRSILIEDNPELVQAIRVDQGGLRETIERLEKEQGIKSKDINGNPRQNNRFMTKESASEPKHRWIRTLDGEFFVNDDKVVVKVPDVDEATGEPKKDPETGEVIMKEEVKHVYNFIKTSVGNEIETDVINTTSIYGKVLTEEERRYIPTEKETVNKQAGEKGDVGDTGTTKEELSDAVKLKREQIGTAHLGHITKDKQYEEIEMVALRWATEVIARWKHEVDSEFEQDENKTEKENVDKPNKEEGAQTAPSSETVGKTEEKTSAGSETNAHLPDESLPASDLPSV